MRSVDGTVNEALIADVVGEVLRRLGTDARGVGEVRERISSPAAAAASGKQAAVGSFGVFSGVDAAVVAAGLAQRKLAQSPVGARAAAVDAIRAVLRRDKEELGRLEFEETRIGRLAHKFEKLDLAASVPGVELLRTEATSGDHGLTVTEFAPYGVVGVVTPVTHSVPTLGCNAIMIVAAGNGLVCNPHPNGARCAVEATRRFNQAIVEQIGIDNLVCTIANPTLDTAGEIFKHPQIQMLLVTGGPGVARAALASGKRAVVAGPGNPPVVVDETADLDKAARGIIQGAGYDNNLLCIGEKEVFVVQAVAEPLLAALARHGAHRLSTAQMDELATRVLHRDETTGHWHARKEYIGQDAAVLAEVIGVRIDRAVPLLFGPVDERNPLLPCEQMMPLLPVLAVPDVATAIAKAVQYEHGFKHTAMIWSRDVETLTQMGRACDTTLYVKNGPCMAGLGVGGQGYCSFSIASPTGEGVTSPLSFTRYRRCVMVDSLRIF
ncbi:MAG: aldehyde dehydrogenase [Phycisphaerales bacterium]|nr:aldehyde dehydrogenase [Phycisphaerales bacterium]